MPSEKSKPAVQVKEEKQLTLFTFPTLGISVMAVDMKEATKEAERIRDALAEEAAKNA